MNYIHDCWFTEKKRREDKEVLKGPTMALKVSTYKDRNTYFHVQMNEKCQLWGIQYRLAQFITHRLRSDQHQASVTKTQPCHSPSSSTTEDNIASMTTSQSCRILLVTRTSHCAAFCLITIICYSSSTSWIIFHSYARDETLCEGTHF